MGLIITATAGLFLSLHCHVPPDASVEIEGLFEVA